MAKLTSGAGWSLSSDTPPSVVPQLNPNSPKPVIRLEKRVGKYVTVVSGLHTYGSERLNGMAKEWKTLCGAGGTVKNGGIEIQGDKVNVIRAWFLKKIFR
jgi:translation initiation factor 1